MQLIKDLEHQFTKHADSAIALQQAAYMKNISPYLGLKKPVRAELEKAIFKTHKLTQDELISAIKTLWRKNEREYAYAALDLLIYNKKLWTAAFLPLFEELIEHKPWWDTIDILAANCVGPLLRLHPELVGQMDTWIKDQNMWKRRVALLYQLKYKGVTDTHRLAKYITLTMHEREFFIAKAIGWALREYSKTNPTWVRTFINTHKGALAPLSIREGGKYC